MSFSSSLLLSLDSLRHRGVIGDLGAIGSWDLGDLLSCSGDFIMLSNGLSNPLYNDDADGDGDVVVFEIDGRTP
ncbi:hypothetical protein WICPIJ_002220 [Wickerhamomyces pijperi]|uniref:Uncharacterized protein n=1 Tax=Wickerhamomyces pijperi TaxID=599730 RepID=A0A9P8Q9I5_WICPI|nr:hypothetical protein WICPIJ_002220 [Wickerhamomyces pijperi]